MRISDWSSDVCSSDLNGSDHSRQDVDKRRGFEIQASANEHFGQRYERRREIDECLHTQQIRDHWLPVIISSDTREEKLRQSQAAIQDQHQPERLPNLLNVQDRRLHECADKPIAVHERSEEQTSELQSLMRNSYAFFCLKKKK